MTKKEKTAITDLLANENFIRWVKSPNPQLDLYWSRWMEEHPESTDLIENARSIVTSLKQQSVPDELYSFKEEAFRSILSSSPTIKVASTPSKSEWVSQYGYLFKIAAILVVVLGISLITSKYLHQESTAPAPVVKVITKENPSGQKIKFQLPDKSIVWLNAESRLTFPERFEGTRRVVTLKGEAFFDVEHDPEHPFDVVSGKIVTTVLGTSFNVRSFEKDENDLKISLVTGRVKVQNRESGDAAEIIPGQQVTYSRQSNQLEKGAFDIREMTAWKEGILLFRKSSFQHVKRNLERWYGVEIEAEGKLNRPWSVNGEFDHQSIERVLERLAFAENFTFTIREKKITIKF
ncbi:MAG: FecR domain-containing protein [Cyclobacteriaceae bacterium]|nr:FecR domain-containing protein [Cyclobacteriaceae bacterium HetDA_MAG_MS6]